jgi:hypothetical protein
VAFSGEREGDGVLYDLSINGCRMVSRTPLRIGHAVNLMIYQGGEHAPITVGAAEVRWNQSLQYGLSFRSPDAEDAIRRLITSKSSQTV